MDVEEQHAKEKAIEARKELAPKVGQKPVVGQKPTVGQKPVATRKRPANQAKVEDAVPDVVEDAVPVEDAKPTRNGQSNARRPQPRDPRKAVRPSVPNPAAKNTAAKTTAAKNNSARSNGSPGATTKQDGTPANGKASPEIPGLISDRSRRKKQDRKRG
jgi:hypothetical protein